MQSVREQMWMYGWKKENEVYLFKEKKSTNKT